MSFMSPQRLGALVAAILLPATLHAALPTPAEAPERSFLTGQLLIASPTMGDPRFLQTVILMVQHDRNGALGIVINRPLGDRPLAQLLEALGEKDPGLLERCASLPAVRCSGTSALFSTAPTIIAPTPSRSTAMSP
jgi:Uncharacterized ACR, COG1678